MNQQQFTQFKQHYLHLQEEELEQLHARKATLVEEAQVALAAVIAERGVSVETIRRANAIEDAGAIAAASAKAEYKARRDAKLFKWMLIFGVPLIGVRVVLTPEAAWSTLVSSLVQALGLAAIAWLVLFLKRKLGN
jgi:hypothetical protein